MGVGCWMGGGVGAWAMGIWRVFGNIAAMGDWWGTEECGWAQGLETLWCTSGDSICLFARYTESSCAVDAAHDDSCA